jgi:hypothetical protein
MNKIWNKFKNAWDRFMRFLLRKNQKSKNDSEIKGVKDANPTSIHSPMEMNQDVTPVKNTGG